MLVNSWNYMYDNFEYIEIFSMTMAVVLISEIPVFVFTLLDLLQLKCLEKYRISYAPMSTRKYPNKDTICRVLKYSYGSFFKIYTPIFVGGTYICYLFDIRPYVIERRLPSIIYSIVHVFLLTIISDILFYLLHRLFHTRFLYKRFHKFHHSYNYVFAGVHHYIHEVETVVFILPALIPPIVMRSHIILAWIYILFIQFIGIYGHSGYMFFIPISRHLPFMRSDYHDAHHYLFNKNFGLTWTFVDKFFGTLSLPINNII